MFLTEPYGPIEILLLLQYEPEGFHTAAHAVKEMYSFHSETTRLTHLKRWAQLIARRVKQEWKQLGTIPVSIKLHQLAVVRLALLPSPFI